MRTSSKSHHVGVVTNVAGRPAERSLRYIYDVSTTEKRCPFIAITDQLMASSTPRYGTHAHKSRWKISPWLLMTVSSSLSRSPCAITSSGLARRRLYITVAGTVRGLVDTKINSEGLLRLSTKFSTLDNTRYTVDRIVGLCAAAW